MAKSKYPVLTAIVGPSKGKRFPLKKDIYVCGADRKSSIRLKGEFVSDEHFAVRLRDDGNWVAENKSEYGTLVNAQRVETRILADGDNIQVGRSNVLVFTAAQSSGPEIVKEEGTSSFSAKKAAIGVGIIVYIIGMIYGAMVLTGNSGNAAGGASVGVERIELEVANTLEYLRDKTLPASSKDIAVRSVDRAQLSYSYFRILDMQSAGVEGADLEREYSALEDQLRSKMFSVYQLSATGQKTAALRVLDDVYATVPDVRAPITILSLSLRTKIKGSTASE